MWPLRLNNGQLCYRHLCHTMYWYQNSVSTINSTFSAICLGYTLICCVLTVLLKDMEEWVYYAWLATASTPLL